MIHQIQPLIFENSSPELSLASGLWTEYDVSCIFQNLSPQGPESSYFWPLITLLKNAGRPSDKETILASRNMGTHKKGKPGSTGDSNRQHPRNTNKGHLEPSKPGNPPYKCCNMHEPDKTSRRSLQTQIITKNNTLLLFRMLQSVWYTATGNKTTI